MTVAVDDDLWSAVGDPTRRRMLDLLLAEGGGTATTLSEHLPVTRQAVAKHLGVLDRVGLVHVTPAGRERRYRVDDAQLARAVAQLADVGATWDARLRRIKRIAETIQRNQDKHSREPHTGRGVREMVDILHKVGVKSSPDDVYEALTTRDGLAGWWTEDTNGTAEVGGVLEFRFEQGGFDMEVLELEPAKRVQWLVTDGPEEWKGTHVNWELNQDGDYTTVLFKHEGWKEPVEFMHHCSTKWATYLMSLKQLVETGTGALAPARRQDRQLGLASCPGAS